MREENRFPLYVSYHIVMALLLAFAIAFYMLHPYSMSHRELSTTEQLWRTFDYVFPKWYFTIFSAAGILALFSFGSYGLLKSMTSNEDSPYKTVYTIALVAGLGIFGVIYWPMPVLFGFILVPAIVQCFVLMLIEWGWGEPSEKAKRVSL